LVPVLKRASFYGDEYGHPNCAALDPDVFQHPDVLDRAADLGVKDLTKGEADLFSGRHGFLDTTGYGRGEDARSAQGAGGRHALPAVPLHRVGRPPRVGPGDVPAPVPAPQHAPAPPSPPR